MKPTAPENTISPSSTSAVMVGSTWAICASGSVVRARCPATYAITVARMKTTPPIVGVPFLLWCMAGPSARIGWPALSRVNTLIAIGVQNSETRNATADGDDDRPHAATPSPGGVARSASATSQVRYREPFTRTTSPGRSSPRSTSTAAA